MAFLNDVEIASRVRAAARPLATPVRDDGFDHKDSAVQASSLDLTIGEIYVPGTVAGRPGAHDVPKKSLTLAQGETALIRTAETLDLPDDLGAVAYPPSSVSIRGLLMTNPGHVDPGYSGRLHFTVINMGKDPFPLTQGQRIVSVLFFQLRAPAAIPYHARKGRAGSTPGQVSHELLQSLSHDFLDVKGRANAAARSAVQKAEWWPRIGVPITTGILGVVATIIVGALTFHGGENAKMGGLSERLSKMEGRLGAIGANVDLDSLENRLTILEKNQQKRP